MKCVCVEGGDAYARWGELSAAACDGGCVFNAFACGDGRGYSKKHAVTGGGTRFFPDCPLHNIKWNSPKLTSQMFSKVFAFIFYILLDVTCNIGYPKHGTCVFQNYAPFSLTC